MVMGRMMDKQQTETKRTNFFSIHLILLQSEAPKKPNFTKTKHF